MCCIITPLTEFAGEKNYKFDAFEGLLFGKDCLIESSKWILEDAVPGICQEECQGMILSMPHVPRWIKKKLVLQPLLTTLLLRTLKELPKVNLHFQCVIFDLPSLWSCIWAPDKGWRLEAPLEFRRPSEILLCSYCVQYCVVYCCVHISRQRSNQEPCTLYGGWQFRHFLVFSLR